MAISLTLELVNNLDIHVARMTGFLQDAKYNYLLEEYELDSTQCLLWMEISQLLAEVLNLKGFEEISLTEEEFGLEIKKVLAEKGKKFHCIIQLLNQYDVLHENTKIGKIINETVEDIEAIYQSIEKDLSKLLSTREEIQEMVDIEYEIEEIDVDDKKDKEKGK